MTQEQEKEVQKALHEAVMMSHSLFPPGLVFTRDSKTDLPPDSRVSVNINGKEILTTEAELEKVLQEESKCDNSDPMTEKYLYPGNAIKPREQGDGYIDYRLSEVLASHGHIIRELKVNGEANLITYKCIDGNRVKGYQTWIQEIPEGRLLEKDECRMSLHAQDLIVRYFMSEDGSFRKPMWHTIIPYHRLKLPPIKVIEG